MLNRFCFASVTLRSKVANFSSSPLPQALNIGGAPPAHAHSLFLSFIKIAFVCLADWGSASDTLSDALSDTLSFSPSNLAFDYQFQRFNLRMQDSNAKN